jgi:hypothetical protein
MIVKDSNLRREPIRIFQSRQEYKEGKVLYREEEEEIKREIATINHTFQHLPEACLHLKRSI